MYSLFPLNLSSILPLPEGLRFEIAVMRSASTLPLKMVSSVSRGSGCLRGNLPKESWPPCPCFGKQQRTHPPSVAALRPSQPSVWLTVRCTFSPGRCLAWLPTHSCTATRVLLNGHIIRLCFYREICSFHAWDSWRGADTWLPNETERIQLNRELKLGTGWEMGGNRNSIYRMCVFWNLFLFNAEHKIWDFTNAFRDKLEKAKPQNQIKQNNQNRKSLW